MDQASTSERPPKATPIIETDTMTTLSGEYSLTRSPPPRWSWGKVMLLSFQVQQAPKWGPADGVSSGNRQAMKATVPKPIIASVVDTITMRAMA